MTPPDRDKRRGDPDFDDDAPSRPSSPDQTPLPRPVPHHVADPTVQPERISHDALDDDDIEELEPDEELDGDADVDGDEDLAAELATRQRPRISAEDLEKLERDSEAELLTDQRESLPVTDASDLFQRPRPPGGDDDPFEDEKTPPPAFLADFAKHGPEDAETRPHEKADLADLAIDDNDADGRDD